MCIQTKYRKITHIDNMALRESDTESDHFEDAVESLNIQEESVHKRDEHQSTFDDKHSKQNNADSRFRGTEGIIENLSKSIETSIGDTTAIQNTGFTDNIVRCADTTSGDGDLNVLLQQDTDSKSSDSDSEESDNFTESAKGLNESETNTNVDEGCDNPKSSENTFMFDSPEFNEADAKEQEVEQNDTEVDEIVVDEEVVKQQEALLTDEELEERRNTAQHLKEDGNTAFRNANYEVSRDRFTSALTICPLCFAKDRSIMYSNRGACKLRQEKYESCIADCSKALQLNPNYLKALLRRADCFEKTEKLDEALEDYNKALEMDASLLNAREACMRLPEEIKDRNEKMKTEMLGKLKDLGNMVLRPFGLSTNNFQMNQDPNTGGYSVNFVQNTNNGNNKSS